MKVRQAIPSIIYNTEDISAQVAPFLLGVTVEEAVHGEADRVEITLDNIDGRWFEDWFPDDGALLEVALTLKDWYVEGQDERLDAGKYRISTLDLSGPPSRIALVGLSADVTKSMRREKKTHSWEGASIERIASDVAERNGLDLLYDGPAIIRKRIDQHNQADLAFIRELVEPYDLFFKIQEGRLVIVSASALVEAMPAETRPIISLAAVERYGEQTRSERRPGYKSYRFRWQTHTTYKAATVRYFDQTTSTKIVRTVEAEGITSGETLSENIQADNPGDAEVKASAILARANRRRLSASIELPGRPELVAGALVRLEGFGQLDRDLLVFKSRHVYDARSGYTTSLELLEL